MATVNLLHLLDSVSTEGALQFISNRLDDDQFPLATNVYDVQVEADSADMWIYDYALYLSDNTDELIDCVGIEHQQKEVFDTYDVISKINNLDPLVIKRAFITYLGESEHQGWDGWTQSQADAILRFYQDFLLGIESTEDDLKPFTIGGITVAGSQSDES